MEAELRNNWHLALLIVFFPTLSAQGFAKRPLSANLPITGKKVVEVESIRNGRIQLPDGTWKDFGSEYVSRLITQLQNSNQFVVADLPDFVGPSLSLQEDPNYAWPGSVVPSAQLKIKVEALSFQTGSRGNRAFYGFNERFRTPYNSGEGTNINEFALSAFGHQFDEIGSGLFASRAGLDLIENYSLSWGFGGLQWKSSRYRCELRLLVTLDQPELGIHRSKRISTDATGFFAQASANSSGYSIELLVARRDAMLKATQEAMTQSFDFILTELDNFPRLGRVDAILKKNQLLMGVGPGVSLSVGMHYRLVNHPSVVIEVVQPQWAGALAHIVQGQASLVQNGALLQEVTDVRVHSESLTKLQSKSQRSSSSAIASLLELPYLLMRYLNYDQPYRAPGSESETREGEREDAEWRKSTAHSSWAETIGFQDNSLAIRSSSIPPGQAPTVAILDTGMDYNHSVLRSHLWWNAIPLFGMGDGPSAKADQYGWDFTSGDSRPFDDAYRGTEVASLVSALAPSALLMPLKIFDPYGNTTSASIWAAFTYAVDHGASVILCAWSTPVFSRALEEGIRYARDHGVLVVVSSGDEGLNLSLTPHYPVSWSKKYPHILAVRGTDENSTNYGAEQVELAAPSAEIEVPQPRGHYRTASGSRLAAALVAGAAARELFLTGEDLSKDPVALKNRLIENAVTSPLLTQQVRMGKVLHLTR